MTSIETVVREHLCKAVKKPADQSETLNLQDSLAYDYGLGSLDLIMLMTSVCNDSGVALTELTEDDIARLSTPSDIVGLLTTKLAS